MTAKATVRHPVLKNPNKQRTLKFSESTMAKHIGWSLKLKAKAALLYSDSPRAARTHLISSDRTQHGRQWAVKYPNNVYLVTK